ncbi:MAG: amidophosphoribosyltransferase [Bacteroidales bacterium]
MSEQIKHECGIALIRLLKPLEYYLFKYGTAFYGLNKLHLLMEKQHNRGHDGAGIAGVKLDTEPGQRYISHMRSVADTPVNDIFFQVFESINKIRESYPDRLRDVEWLKNNIDFTGELFLGHLRYGTYGDNDLRNVHPFIRQNNWKTRNLILAGNFNLTNVGELFDMLVEIGQYPLETSDTVTILEKIGHFLDYENEELYRKFKQKGFLKKEISAHIAENLDLQKILSNASSNWDGGYVIAGMLGHGDAFVLRDPAGIRPAFYYADDEVIVITSERPAIQTAFNVPFGEIKEIKPGHALIVKQNGDWVESKCIEPVEKSPCSFERIYFSRGTDAEIYLERKKLGRMLTHTILKTVDYNLTDTVFSYIPNTAAVAYYGMVESLNEFCNKVKCEKLLQHKNELHEQLINEILSFNPRVEKVAVKDHKLRTFISQDIGRDDLVAHVYDVTYGIVRTGIDTLVVLDDSIVRGTTLRKSIIHILDRLGPKHIVIASSAPQIRYPDCYGIDMAKLGDFIAFRAAIALLRESHQSHIINEVYRKCKQQENLPAKEIVNHVKEIYRPFSADQISEKISELVRPATVNAKVSVVFNTIENLHEACPNHKGDWYFTGNYPTPGGNKVVNRSFINYIEGRNVRAY